MPNNPKENASKEPDGKKLSRRGFLKGILLGAATAGTELVLHRTADASSLAAIEINTETGPTGVGVQPAESGAVASSAAGSATEAIGEEPMTETDIRVENAVRFKAVNNHIFWLEQDGGLYVATKDPTTEQFTKQTLLSSESAAPATWFDVFYSNEKYSLVVKKPTIDALGKSQLLFKQMSELTQVNPSEVVTNFDDFDVGEVVCSELGGSPFLVFTAGNAPEHRYLYYGERVQLPATVDANNQENVETATREMLKSKLVAKINLLRPEQLQKIEVLKQLSSFGIESKVDDDPVEDMAEELIATQKAGYDVNIASGIAWLYMPVFTEGSKVSKLSTDNKPQATALGVTYCQKTVGIETTTDWLSAIEFSKANGGDIQYSLPQIINGESGVQTEYSQTVTEGIGNGTLHAASYADYDRVLLSWVIDGQTIPKEEDFQSRVVDLDVDSVKGDGVGRAVVIVTLENGDVWQLNVIIGSTDFNIEKIKLEGVKSERSAVELLDANRFVLTTQKDGTLVQQIIKLQFRVLLSFIQNQLPQWSPR